VGKWGRALNATLGSFHFILELKSQGAMSEHQGILGVFL
jgi:hypothetical protein